MRPTHLSRLIIDGFQHSLAKDSVVCPSPAVLTVLGLREIDTVGIPRADDEQPGLGVKTRRAVICRAAFVRRNQSPVTRWILRRVGNWAAVFVDPGGPIDSREGSRKKAASRSAVQHKEITISRSLQQHLSGDTLEIAIDEDRNLDGIPIMRIVGRRLEPPSQLTGVGIQRHDAACPRIVSRTILGRQHRRGISCSDVNEIELWIIRSRNPHVSAGGATAESLRCFSGKSAVKGPLNVPGFRIKRLQHASQIVEISGRANNDVVANRQRRHGCPIPLLYISDYDIPLHLPVSCIQRDQVRVWRREIDRKSTRLNSSHGYISYAVFCLKKKNKI